MEKKETKKEGFVLAPKVPEDFANPESFTDAVNKKVSEIDLLKDKVPQPPIDSIEVFKEAAKSPDIVQTPLGAAINGKLPEVNFKTKAAIRKEMDTTLSKEERIEAFIEDKKDWVKLNDFLKTLYPIPRFNEPPVYLDKGEMKRMRILLDNMQSHGKLQIKDNGHGKLGNHYYEGEQQYAKFWHIGNLTIEAKK